MNEDWHDNPLYKEQGWGCCCECGRHLKLFSHPDVDGKPMSNQLGFVCLFPDDREHIAVMSDEHGCCELFERRRRVP